ncbi:uncharacterized protein [Ambystoma mexicanum]|uniref:uncharacterized protein n=1 Tax=Ambystoma mexicanum TaxID=8296 RepID=UPI0037E90FF0
MSLFKRTWMCVLFGTIALIVIINYMLTEPPIFRDFKKYKMLEIASITPLHDNRTFIIGAYYDNREKSLIRIIAILNRRYVNELYCWLICSNIDGFAAIQKVGIDILAHDFGFPYVIGHLLCPTVRNCTTEYVAIHLSDKRDSDKLPLFEIRNRSPSAFTAEFTVCISTMFGNSTNALQFIQTIEMYKLLGAQKVMIYNHSCSSLIDKVMKHYIAEGTVEVIPWPIDFYLDVSTSWHFTLGSRPKDLGYYGQLATLNDCLYRNMYKSKYVVLIDMDEIIMPKKHQNWASMMAYLQKKYRKRGIFIFENHVFPNNVFDLTFNLSAWKAIPGDNVLLHVYREPGTKYHEKMIVNPRKVIQISVHTVLKTYSRHVKVSRRIAMLQHYREALQPNLPRASLIKDTTIWKFSASLIHQVDVLKNHTSLF